MIFRQLFEEISSTYTYLLGCEETGRAILIDPVLPTWQRDLEVLKDLNLELAYTLADEDGKKMLMVYFPMSYQIGGYTLTIPESAVTRLDISMEEAMRHVLTAGMVKSDSGRREGRHRDQDERTRQIIG